MRRVAVVLAIVALAACSSSDDSSASGTIDLGPIATATGGLTPKGFDTIGLTIRDANDATRDFCLWLAATPDERQQGLMKVTDLGGKAGMLFSFDVDTQERFWMFQTVVPLSIAFFDSTGEFVSSTDMDPCIGSDSTKCPVYEATAQYRDAIEVPQGTLGDLGIGPGSALVERGACPA